MALIQLVNALLLPLCNLVCLRKSASVTHRTQAQNANLQKKRVRKQMEKRQRGFTDVFDAFA